MQTNPIPGVMNTLKEAGFDEDQRLAITTAITDMQYPLLDAIKELRSEIKQMDTRMRHMAIAIYGLFIPVLFILYQVAPTSG